MKLRTQLIVAFFLLAVVPLAGVSIYSYNSSIRAFRQVVEAESGYLAEDMSQRMESVSNDLETESCILRYVNAGHNPQFALHADGSSERLESTGRPLGILPGAGYNERQVALKDGDSLSFYTDGLVETENEANEEFGMERLEKLLFEERSRGLEGILANVERAAREFRGNVDAADDAAMLSVRIGKSMAGQA